MNTINNAPAITEIERNNLDLIYALGEFSHDFKTYAKSINNLFYFYIEECLHKKTELYISDTDVYNLNKLVNLFNELEFEKK